MARLARGILEYDVGSVPDLDEAVLTFLANPNVMLNLAAVEWSVFVIRITSSILETGEDIRDTRGYDTICSVLATRFPTLENFQDTLRRKLRCCFKRTRRQNKVVRAPDGAVHVGLEANLAHDGNGNHDSGLSIFGFNQADPESLAGDDEDEYHTCVEDLSFEGNISVEAFPPAPDEPTLSIVENMINAPETTEAPCALEETVNLINLDSFQLISSVGNITFNNVDYLHQIVKRLRPLPSNMLTSYDRCQALKYQYATFGNSSETLALFRQTFEHRSITSWTQDIFTLAYSYPCLENLDLIQQEAKEVYSQQELLHITDNMVSLMRAIEEYHSNLNEPYNVQYFFTKLNPCTNYFRIFQDSAEYMRFAPMLTDESPCICILLEQGKVLEIKLLTFGFKISVSSISDGLVAQILMYNLFCKSFPVLRSMEFKVLDAFMFGRLPLDLPNRVLSYLNDITAVFSELETIDSSNAV